MQKEEAQQYFNRPVDPTEHPDYVSRVQKPMDLGTVHGKLFMEVYDTVEAVLRDVQLLGYLGKAAKNS
ncbi:hypothetical protein GPECTOR_9g694 [Gonium pectorale]|uniref:Bromo domain-containing protein n=1 Tax=Gonium pectorale TaxID=33097 RepID=A0A150GS03_GONPE|nr:hypothetical protein GPECTOR_9g694 [Gonium pectorale]|eukprot:KXZ52649.1 hypothetical protein GPECTOR_9g694 [Gonium pectorale]